jgi:hypothetical protein
MQAQLRDLLVTEGYETITELAGRNRRVLSFLTALTYDPDRLVSWRAVEAIGLASVRVADDDPEYVRIHLRRMQWLLNDESGGIGWRFPETIGEIIRNGLDRFPEFVPILISLFDLEEEDVIKFRPGILWAVGRVGEIRPAAVQTAIPWILPCLQDSDPQTRGMAAWCLGKIGAGHHLAGFQNLLNDGRLVEVYMNGQLASKSVAALTRDALAEQS